MAGRYGMSFARALIEKGRYDEAIASATEDIDGGTTGPQPWFDRGVAHELAERYADAVRDLERAIEINHADQEIDEFALEDAYFSATLAAAEHDATTSLATALARLDHYRELFPEGAHVGESRDWQKRLRGELPSLLDKTRDDVIS